MIKKITFKEHFEISKKEYVDFVNIPLQEDLEAFICPFLIANNRDNDIVERVYSQLTAFFVKLNRDYIVKNDKKNGLPFLSHLHEPNEYHFGYSKSNKGKAIAVEKATVIFHSLYNNKFAKSGVSITNEAHNVLLLVDGIGQDLMSDTIANVCRNIFAEFTEEQCVKHSIVTHKTKIEFYNPITSKWDWKEYNLPYYKGKALILIPKVISSGSRQYSVRYNWFISSNFIAKDLINNKVKPVNEKVLIKLKDGTKKAIIKEICKVYSKPKKDLIDFVLKYNGSLSEFLDYAKGNYPHFNFENVVE